MEHSNLISTHILQSDYSMKGKLKSVLIAWCIFLIIFGITRVPATRVLLLNIQNDLGASVEWVDSTIRFILNGLWVFFIPLTIGTPLTLLKKHPFNTLRIYESGIGFVHDGNEQFKTYDKLSLSWGGLQQSFYIDCKDLAIKGISYGFGEFSQPEVLKSNLCRIYS